MLSSLSTCSWFSTTATDNAGVIQNIGHLVCNRVLIDRHRNGAKAICAAVKVQ